MRNASWQFRRRGKWSTDQRKFELRVNKTARGRHETILMPRTATSYEFQMSFVPVRRRITKVLLRRNGAFRISLQAPRDRGNEKSCFSSHKRHGCVVQSSPGCEMKLPREITRLKEDERFVTLRSVGLPSDTKPIITNYNTSDIQDPPHECSIVSIPPPPFLEETIRGSRSPLLGTKDTRVEKCSCQSYDTSPLGQV